MALPSLDFPLVHSVVPVGATRYKIFVRATGHETLSTVSDHRLELVVQMFRVIAKPEVAMAHPTGTRLDHEQVFMHHGMPSPRVNVWLERAVGGVTFYIDVVDSRMSLDLGLSRFSESQHEYVDTVLSPHATIPIDVAKATVLDLTNSNNPACLANVVGNVEAEWQFPNGATFLPPLVQHPTVLLHYPLVGGRVLPRDEAVREYWAARGDGVDAVEQDALEAMREANERDPANAEARYQSLLMSWANISPALRAALTYVPGPVAVAAPATFAEMVSWFTQSLEDEFQCLAYHSEVQHAFAASLGVFEYDYSLKHHILYAGSAAAGKSFILNTLKRLLIPDTFVCVSYETNRANATETNMNATIVLHDEVSSDLFKPGVGDPELKERLSTGRTTSRVFVMEGNKRKTRAVTSKQQILFIGCCNENLEALPDPVRSRFHCHEIAALHRQDRDFVQVLGEHPDANKQRAFCDWTRRIQTMAAHVYTRIYLGLLPPVDMRPALAALQQVQTRLRARGLEMDKRALSRVVLLARSLAILFAIATGNATEQITCTDEMALFCLTPAKVGPPSLWRALRQLQYVGDSYPYLEHLVFRNKKVPAQIVAQLQGKRWQRESETWVDVYCDNPPRVHEGFFRLNVEQTLIQAIRSVHATCLLGWTKKDQPWLWERVI